MSQPSRSELIILKILWEQSPLSAREIQDLIKPRLDWSFSTTRTTLSRMAKKSLLILTQQHGVRVYAPAQSKTRTLSIAMRDFFDTVLDIKGPLPTAAFHDNAILNPEEWAELDRFLNESAKEESSDHERPENKSSDNQSSGNKSSDSD